MGGRGHLVRKVRPAPRGLMGRPAHSAQRVNKARPVLMGAMALMAKTVVLVSMVRRVLLVRQGPWVRPDKTAETARMVRLHCRKAGDLSSGVTRIICL